MSTSDAEEMPPTPPPAPNLDSAGVEIRVDESEWPEGDPPRPE